LPNAVSLAADIDIGDLKIHGPGAELRLADLHRCADGCDEIEATAALDDRTGRHRNGGATGSVDIRGKYQVAIRNPQQRRRGVRGR
jgi:hypothetical protein